MSYKDQRGDGRHLIGGPHFGAGLDPPIFDYLNLTQRHISGRRPPRADMAMARGIATPHAPRDARRDVGAKVTTDLCWSGTCPGCGRGLISAVHHVSLPGDAFYCTRACRAAHV